MTALVTPNRPDDRIRSMPQDLGWLRSKAEQPEPRQEFITTLWRMRGTSGRNIECCAYRVETGLELRTMYTPTEIIASQLFPATDPWASQTARANFHFTSQSLTELRNAAFVCNGNAPRVFQSWRQKASGY